MVEQLTAISEPHHNAGIALKRLRYALSDVFRRHGGIISSSRRDRRLTIVFTGFLDVRSPPAPAWAVITNFQDIKRRTEEGVPWDEFRLYQSPDPGEDPKNLVLTVGAWQALTDADFKELDALLASGPRGIGYCTRLCES